MTLFQKIREKIEEADTFRIERMRFAAIVVGVFVFGIVLRGMMFSPVAQKDVLAAAQPALVAASVALPEAGAVPPAPAPAKDAGGDESVFTEDDAVPVSAATSTGPVAEISRQQAAPLAVQTPVLSPDMPPALLADAYIVARGAMPLETVYAKNIHERRAPASLTKLMTATIVAEQIPDDEIVTITDNAVKTEGVAGYLRAGERFRAADLMKIMLIVSSNDAAVAFADHFTQKGDDFVAHMNEKAHALGMQDTHFANPSGLDDPDHYSSAFDLALLTAYSLRHEKIWNILSEKEDTVYSIEKRPHTLLSNNPVIQQHTRGVKGSKTGYTANASGCLIVAMDTGEVIVVLGSTDRGGDAERLIRTLERAREHL